MSTSLGAQPGSHNAFGEFQTSTELSNSVTNFLNSQNGYNSSRPKAFLNWVLLDERFNYVSSSSGFDQVGASDAYTTHVKSNMPVSKSGYLYIFVSNSTQNIDVFFDNLQVTHVRGPLLEETHFYPSGLAIAGLISNALAFGSPENKLKFNGKEDQSKEFGKQKGLEWIDFGARNYDPQIMRWFNPDKFTDVYLALSPFQYAANNPIKNIDVAGHLLRDKDGNIIATSNGMAPPIKRDVWQGGVKKSLVIEVERVTIYTDKGTPVQALRAVKAYMADYKEDGKTVGDYKEEKLYKNFRSNCHGYALADGTLWIGTTDDQGQVGLRTIIADEYSEDDNGSYVVIEWTDIDNNDGSSDVTLVHSGFVNSDGTYNQKDDVGVANSNASREDFTQNGERLDTHDGQRFIKENSYNKKSSDRKTTKKTFKNQSEGGIRITDPDEIKEIFLELGWQEK